MGFVIGDTGLQTVMQLAEELVEQVTLGLAVPVSAFSSSVVVAFGAGGDAQRRQCPDRSYGGETVVFDAPVGHDGLFAAGPSDWR